MIEMVLYSYYDGKLLDLVSKNKSNFKISCNKLYHLNNVNNATLNPIYVFYY